MLELPYGYYYCKNLILQLDRTGKENVVVDFLSRLTPDDDTPVDDSFLDEYLFAVFAHSPWYADISNYLVVGKLPPHLSHP